MDNYGFVPTKIINDFNRMKPLTFGDDNLLEKVITECSKILTVRTSSENGLLISKIGRMPNTGLNVESHGIGGFVNLDFDEPPLNPSLTLEVIYKQPGYLEDTPEKNTPTSKLEKSVEDNSTVVASIETTMTKETENIDNWQTVKPKRVKNSKSVNSNKQFNQDSISMKSQADETQNPNPADASSIAASQKFGSNLDLQDPGDLIDIIDLKKLVVVMPRDDRFEPKSSSKKHQPSSNTDENNNSKDDKTSLENVKHPQGDKKSGSNISHIENRSQKNKNLQKNEINEALMEFERSLWNSRYVPGELDPNDPLDAGWFFDNILEVLRASKKLRQKNEIYRKKRGRQRFVYLTR